MRAPVHQVTAQVLDLDKVVTVDMGSVRAQLPMDAIAQEARARHGVDSKATATIHEVIDRSLISLP